MEATLVPSTCFVAHAVTGRRKLRRFPCTVALHSKSKSQSHDSYAWRSIRRLLKSYGDSIARVSPEDSLKQGHWVKLICGASFEDVADVRNLSLVYTLAGVDCIDCAAEESVVTAVNEGIDMAQQICLSGDIDERLSLRRPWVMISVNDDKDLHFRKAQFNPEDCPVDCSRPCEKVCPADAIKFESATVHSNVPYNAASLAKFQGGVISERCYGCGRCLPVCPYDKIRANAYIRSSAAITELLHRGDVDSIEIHTSAGHLDSFRELWNNMSDAAKKLKLISVSLPDLGDSTIHAMKAMYSVMKPFLQSYNLWQLDGRPMSGDIGKGATKEAVEFAARMAADRNCPPGSDYVLKTTIPSKVKKSVMLKCLLLCPSNLQYALCFWRSLHGLSNLAGFLQLAGGTNSHTIDVLKRIGLFQTTSISGVAYGGYARKVVGKILHKMFLLQDSHPASLHIEQFPCYLLEALEEAVALVGPIKSYGVPRSIYLEY